jgi:hypothetical protein
MLQRKILPTPNTLVEIYDIFISPGTRIVFYTTGTGGRGAFPAGLGRPGREVGLSPPLGVETNNA